jgi:hypothetical protein
MKEDLSKEQRYCFAAQMSQVEKNFFPIGSSRVLFACKILQIAVVSMTHPSLLGL